MSSLASRMEVSVAKVLQKTKDKGGMAYKANNKDTRHALME